MAKPDTITGYEKTQTELAERVLLEAWSLLGDYRDYLVLIGGLVPRYLCPGVTADPHCGSMDVDFGISLAVADVEVYTSIVASLGKMGFVPGKNEQGRDRLHSFEKTIEGKLLNIDFLTVKYDGPKESLMRGVTENLRAIQVEGLGLALNRPLSVPVSGELLSGGRVDFNIRVCRPFPFVVLKALSFGNRAEGKDVYDLVYVLRHFQGGAKAVVSDAMADEIREPSVRHCMEVLSGRFATLQHDGPVKYRMFTKQPNTEPVAYAAVREFISAMQGFFERKNGVSDYLTGEKKEPKPGLEPGT